MMAVLSGDFFPVFCDQDSGLFYRVPVLTGPFVFSLSPVFIFSRGLWPPSKSGSLNAACRKQRVRSNRHRKIFKCPKDVNTAYVGSR